MGKVSKLKIRLVFICFRNAYESGQSVSYEQLESTIPGITSNYRYLLERIFEKLQKEHQYFFDLKSSSAGKFFVPSLHDSYKFDYEKCIKNPLILIENLVLLFKEAYEQNNFVTNRKIRAVLLNKSKNKRGRHRCNYLVESALKDVEEKFGYKFDFIINRGYYPLRDDFAFPSNITKTIELSVVLKKSYESNKFISYADLNSVLPDAVNKYQLRQALSDLKKNYGYEFIRDLKGYYPAIPSVFCTHFASSS